MKYFTFLLFSLALLVSCKNESTLRDQANTTVNPSTTTPATTPSAPSGAVAHYICSTPGCAGPGAASAGNCSICGNALTHNQAYHNNQQSSQPNIAAEGLSPILTTPQGQTQTTTPTTSEPAQNAAGVWHYTCSNGCSGGAGSAIACATCGNTLAHNSAYHN